MKNNLLRIPQGTESLYLEETFRHRKILRHMEDMCEEWGYLPVQTPVFDFYDNYRNLLDSRLEEQSYKLIDREGDLLMLRRDITLFLARQMGMIL
ncbi:MAG: ATP phosphoribosyltransferase regulatory subunit, partial [Spirochaetales bacterium]|nr:ATP phosphoribosyltransferase regulatory subunit [Spirochaetales bacterium]